jgi:hypothetical protein
MTPSTPSFLGNSRHQELQIRRGGFIRISRNLPPIVQAFFVWQRVLTTSEGTNNSYTGLEMLPSALTPGFTDAQRLRAVYANDSTLPQYTFSLNTHYVLPFGRGKTFLNQTNGFVDRLVSGWNVSAFYYWRSGLYFSPYYSERGSAYLLASGKTGALPKSSRNRNQWFDARVCRLDTGQTCTDESYIKRANTLDNDFLNNISRDALTGPGFNNLDATVSKITPVRESLTFQLEAQIFNAYNHVNLGQPNNFGTITSQVGRPRLIQLQAKLVF